MTKRSIKDNVDAVIAYIPAVVTATGTGSAVDLKGYDSALVVINAGTLATGASTLASLTESADGTTYTAVGTGDLQGAFSAITTAASTVQRVGYIGTCRYIKPVVTVGGTGAGGSIGMVAIRGHANRVPLS